MEITHHIQSFVACLSLQKTPSNVCNQYAVKGPIPLQSANRIRRENLQLYLHAMSRLQPTLLLVGEAPGYRGCRQTGVPFTSEALLVQWIQHGFPFSQVQDYYQLPEKKDKLLSESTATILWNTVADLDTVPLLWNAYPFHPHQPGNPHSNRKPNEEELASGRILLEKFMQIFSIRTVVAVGRTAEKTLEAMRLPAIYVRHPSRGGKTAFEQSIRHLRRKNEI